VTAADTVRHPVEGADPVPLDDPTLVERAREGDLAAFEALVVRYQRRIYQLALRMTADRAAAEDITQDVFLAAWRQLPGIREGAAFGGWLYKIATNRCLTVLGRRRPTEELDEELPAPVPGTDRDADPQRAAERAAVLAALTGALQQLTPEQRAAWLLREAHDKSYEEIAEVVDATPQAVRGRLARARAQLAELMSEWR
jgi:RNA polymerase sigma-70 factor (ECF subfamily)